MVHILDLPNEILLMIIKKLDNIDVLYSLFGINNERLDILLQEDVFTNTLNFVRTSSITDNKLDRFYTYILPRFHHCIKKLVLETISMERILLAGDYPNLTSLELFNFDQEQISLFRDDSAVRHIFQYQITDLILHNNDEYISEMRLDTYTKNVFILDMAFVLLTGNGSSFDKRSYTMALICLILLCLFTYFSSSFASPSINADPLCDNLDKFDNSQEIKYYRLLQLPSNHYINVSEQEVLTLKAGFFRILNKASLIQPEYQHKQCNSKCYTSQSFHVMLS
ncbi:unnamed protein product [Rotaria sp. Silwood2]|nr:unnamed protein product [Rotaria sp. Silwood2]